MRKIPMISATAAIGLVEAIHGAGGDPDQILNSLGLPRSVVSDPEGFIPSSTFAEALEAAAHATGDDCFGLHFGERYQAKDVGALVYAALNAPTIRTALENVVRYIRIRNEA